MITEEARSVLETLARSFTDRNDLKVVWGSAPCTDFNKIYLRKESTIVPGVECTPGELWLSRKAIIAHESAHLLFTDEGVWKTFCYGPLESHILNIVEDARVERAMANLFPGVLRWFRFANEYIFVNRKNWIDLLPQDLALHELCSYAVVGRIHDELPEKERKFVQECAPYVDRGRVAKTTEEAAKEAAKIVEIYRKYYKEMPYLPVPRIAFSVKPIPVPDGELDPRRKPKLKPLHEKPEGGKPEGKEPAADDIESRDDDIEPDEITSDKTASRTAKTETGDSKHETVSDGEPSDGEPSDGEPADGETVDGEPADGKPADGGPSGEAAGESGEPDGTDSCGSPDESSGKSGESPSGEGSKEPGSETCSESDDDLLTGIDDLIEKSEKEVARLSSPKTEEVPEEEKIEITEDDIKEKFSLTRCHSTRRLIFRNVDSYPETKAELERNVHTTALLTANEIRKILESRKGGTRRCIPKGRLDRSFLWKTAVKEPNIFMRKNAPSNNPDMAVYLLIDCSGSMAVNRVRKRDCSRLQCAAEAGMLLHKVCDSLNIPHAITGFTTQNFYICPTVHYRLKEFHEKEAKIEAILKEVYCADNVDGFSIRASATELLCRPEPNKVLFVISDGAPYARDYEGMGAVRDTAKAVREAISYGIGVIGIFIGNECEAKYAKEIYPYLIFMDAADLPVILAKTLKTVITNPA
jgi:cobalamin biosynthesis protein CobT